MYLYPSAETSTKTHLDFLYFKLNWRTTVILNKLRFRAAFVSMTQGQKKSFNDRDSSNSSSSRRTYLKRAPPCSHLSNGECLHICTSVRHLSVSMPGKSRKSLTYDRCSSPVHPGERGKEKEASSSAQGLLFLGRATSV